MIDELKKHQLLLCVVAILVVIRFVIVPIIEWQNLQNMEIRLLNSQLDRIERVLDNQSESENYNKSLNDLINQTSDLFYQVDDASKFQLEKQQWLEGQINKFGMETKNIGWVATTETPELNVFSHALQVGINGKTIDAIKLIQSIQSHNKFIEVKNFSFSFDRRSRSALGNTRLRLSILFNRKLENT